MAFNDKQFIERGDWETCWVKKRPSGDEKPDFMGYSAFGIIYEVSKPMIIYLRDDNDPRRDFSSVKEYETVDAMLADGWIVD